VIELPEWLAGGVRVKWFIGRTSNLPFMIMLLLFAFVVVYFKRFDKIDKELKEAEEAIRRDLPELINKLVLLLSAGLVVSTAFSRITADYQVMRESMATHRGGAGKTGFTKHLYEELLKIEQKVQRSNASFMNELKDFSQRSGVREMVRVTAVISDNWNKGSVLAEKLEAEAEFLWISRKKRAEERGRLAETKLTFPLVILLLVLIVITIAPAMMDM